MTVTVGSLLESSEELREMRGELESVYDQLLVEESKSLELQGAPALEVLATGLDPKSGEKVSVYYLLVSGPNPELYFSAYGETPHGKMGEWLEKFVPAEAA